MATRLICKLHPEFQGKVRPSSGCPICLDIYKMEAEPDKDVWEGWDSPLIEYAHGLAFEEAKANGEIPPEDLYNQGPWLTIKEIIFEKRLEECMRLFCKFTEEVEDDE